MAINSAGYYRIFCKSCPTKNITIVNGGNVVGTKLNMQPYLSNSTWQYLRCSEPSSESGQFDFQCNWLSGQQYSDLKPAITSYSTKVEGEQVKLNTSDSTTQSQDRTRIYYESANVKVTVNGCDYDGYYLKFTNGKVMDAKDDYLAVYDKTGDDSQIFAFVPDTPLYDGLLWTVNVSNLDVELNQTNTSTVSLNTSDTKCQARIRKAPLYHNASDFSAYGYYESPAGSKQDDGFEDGTKENIGNSFTMEVEAANSASGIDAWKYEILYRDTAQAITLWPSHGKESLKTYITRQKINFSIDEALIAADGLKISWSSDAYRDDSAVTITLSDVTEDGTLVCEGRTQTFTSATSGAFEIPYTELQRYPVTGSILAVKMQFYLNSTYAIGNDVVSENLIVSGKGGELEPVIDVDTDNGFDLTLEISEKTGQAFDVCTCSMIYEQNGAAVVKELVKTDTNTFFAPARINANTFITVTIKDTTQTAVKYGVNSYTHTYDTRIPTTLVINSEKMEFEFKYSSEQWPGSKNVSPTTASLHKSGKRLPDYYYETNYDNKFTIDGLLFETKDLYKLEMVLREKYLAVRNSKGYYANCAFLGKTTKEVDVDNSECSLEFAEVDRDVDVAIPY